MALAVVARFPGCVELTIQNNREFASSLKNLFNLKLMIHKGMNRIIYSSTDTVAIPIFTTGESYVAIHTQKISEGYARYIQRNAGHVSIAACHPWKSFE